MVTAQKAIPRNQSILAKFERAVNLPWGDDSLYDGYKNVSRVDNQHDGNNRGRLFYRFESDKETEQKLKSVHVPIDLPLSFRGAQNYCNTIAIDKVKGPVYLGMHYVLGHDIYSGYLELGIWGYPWESNALAIEVMKKALIDIEKALKA